MYLRIMITKAAVFRHALCAFVSSVIFYHRYRTYDPDDDQQGLDLTKWANRSRFQYKFAKVRYALDHYSVPLMSWRG